MSFTIESHFPSSVYAISGSAQIQEGPAPPPPAPAPLPPTNILHGNQPASFLFEWTQTGWGAEILAGTWRLNVYFERMGPEEGPASPPSTTVSFNNTPGHTYTGKIDITGLLDPGVYRVVVTLALYSPSGNITPLHSFEDLGILQVV